jgi:metal-responsive CopG/Arc/MetJ family transcriptional regulator
MSTKSKLMISVRLPTSLVERLDFAARNVGSASRSAAIQDALEAWLSSREQGFRELGLAPPKRK